MQLERGRDVSDAIGRGTSGSGIDLSNADREGFVKGANDFQQANVELQSKGLLPALSIDFGDSSAKPVGGGAKQNENRDAVTPPGASAPVERSAPQMPPAAEADRSGDQPITPGPVSVPRLENNDKIDNNSQDKQSEKNDKKADLKKAEEKDAEEKKADSKNDLEKSAEKLPSEKPSPAGPAIEDSLGAAGGSSRDQAPPRHRFDENERQQIKRMFKS